MKGFIYWRGCYEEIYLFTGEAVMKRYIYLLERLL